VGCSEECGIDRGGCANRCDLVADETLLGEERTESRKRGRTIEDVAETVSEGLKAKKSKATVQP